MEFLKPFLIHGFLHSQYVLRGVMTQASDLSLADIEFLQAVRNINKNPEKYPETDRSEVPANTASIKRATGLTSDQVSYRMGGNQNSRGFEDGKNPLIKTYDPVATDTGYAPRAAKLTAAGRSALSEAQKIGSRLEGVTQTEVDRINQRLEYLEIKSNIQDHLILFDHPSIRYTISENSIIGVTRKDGPSASVSKKDDRYEISVENNGEVTNKQLVDTPTEAANLLVNSVSQ